MSHGGTSKFSGKLTELFPGFSKRWFEVLHGIFQPRYGEPERTLEFYLELLDRSIPYIGGDTDKLWKMYAKHGIQRGAPLRKVAELLRDNGVQRYTGYIGDRDVGGILVRRIDVRHLGGDLQGMEAFLVALLDNVTIAEVPYFKEKEGGYSSNKAHTLSTERCLVYKDSLEKFKADPLSSVRRLVKEHAEVSRDLVQFANAQYGEARKALGDDPTGYHDPASAIDNALESTTVPDIADIELLVSRYEHALEASRILLDLLKNPRPVLTDPCEIFLKNLPLVAMGVGIKGCGTKSLTVAKGLAEYILANVDVSKEV